LGLFDKKEDNRTEWEQLCDMTVFGKNYCEYEAVGLSVKHLDLFYSNGWKLVSSANTVNGYIFTNQSD
jgi:hypothetical protein